MSLKISGRVQKVVTLSPGKVRLTGYLEEETAATVKIIQEDSYPFKITDVTVQKKDKYIKYDLKNSSKKEYILQVTNISKNPGRYFDTVTLKTDNKAVPEIVVKVFGNIKSRAQEEAARKIE